MICFVRLRYVGDPALSVQYCSLSLRYIHAYTVHTFIECAIRRSNMPTGLVRSQGKYDTRYYRRRVTVVTVGLKSTFLSELSWYTAVFYFYDDANNKYLILLINHTVPIDSRCRRCVYLIRVVAFISFRPQIHVITVSTRRWIVRGVWLSRQRLR